MSITSTLPTSNCLSYAFSDFMKNLTNWSQKTGAIQKSQHDDAPDSLAGMVSNILTGQVVGRASSKISLDKYGLWFDKINKGVI